MIFKHFTPDEKPFIHVGALEPVSRPLPVIKFGFQQSEHLLGGKRNPKRYLTINLALK
jgi:hypothetical protein